MTADTSPPLYRNDLELQLFGLQRSGNHAVVAWILQQYDQPIVFLNNVAHFHDPFVHFRAGQVDGMVKVSRPNPDAMEQLRVRQKPLLVYSYENMDFSKLSTTPLVPDRATMIGASKRIRRVLLFRDFFNWAASRIRLMEYRKKDIAPVIRDFNPLIDIWLLYAREFLAETDHLGDHDVVRVSYPRWSRDAEYRGYLLGRMGLPFHDNSNSKVPDVGGGSSFDKTSFSGSAVDMQTDQRWTYLLDDRFGPVRAAITARRAALEQYNHAAFGLEWPDI